MYFCVCVKQTPDSASVYVDPITGHVDYERFVQVLNPADACAVEAAVRLKEALYCRGDPRGRPDCTIIVLTLGPKDAEGALRVALAIGADSALRLWNTQAEAWGPFTVAAALAGYIQSEISFPDLVLCGDNSSDWASGIVGPALAQQLGLPQVTRVARLELLEEKEILSEAKDDKMAGQDDRGMVQDERVQPPGDRGTDQDETGWSLDETDVVQNEGVASPRVRLQLTRKLERGYRELLEATLPLLITVTGEINEPRYPSLPEHLAALKAEIPVIDPHSLMDDVWLNAVDETTMLEIHAPRPGPRHIAAPDSQHSAYQRIGEIVAGGATGRKTRLVKGSPEELARVLVEFLRNKGFV